MTNRDRLVVHVERDSAGAWLVSVPSISGCHTYGWSISEARARLREVLALWDAEVDEFDERFRVAPELSSAIASARRARRTADVAVARARVAVVTAARELTDAGCSRRDAATLLGISHQRVQQLLADGGTAARG